ncbi:voltage-dependent calcium channel beta subunit-associated regulatory protein [Engraulis encrasicolus]|uniref:voltage-dependent calcium channel beta subunit-associated regulatory protein n=1 Tax=Engraulis encrasicolus TaxID=184585 RepID=UPI002FD09FEF
MSNESTVWKNLTQNYNESAVAEGSKQDGYVLLLVLLSIFVGGTLVLLSVLLIVCRHCCDEDRRYTRANDDPEKPKTSSYLEESHPVHEITIRVDESDCVSASSSRDMEAETETERFLSTGTQGRRVSFNEAALFDHSKKAQEKGRRYTLTEGDFHHLKNARLTHLSIPPPALKIVTIHECESSENSIAMTTRPASKSSLSIFQSALRPPLPQTALTSLSVVSPSGCALPGDALNSTVDSSSFSLSLPPLPPLPPLPSSTTSTSTSTSIPRAPSPARCSQGPAVIEVMGDSLKHRGGGSSSGSSGEAVSASGVSSAGLASSGQGPVLQFFTKLRRHASLEGASPYLKIKKWKLDSTQRASSLDTRGSPKRRQFQRQRAASESMDQEEHHIDLIQYIASTKNIAYHPTPSASASAPARGSSSILSPLSTPPPSLGRLEVEVVVEPSCSSSSGGGLMETEMEMERMEASSELATTTTTEELGCHRESPSADPPTLYQDIWTLRASLEQCVTSDQSSNNDKDSVRSDADSVCSLGGGVGSGGKREEKGGLQSNPSQDLDVDDNIEVENLELSLPTTTDEKVKEEEESERTGSGKKQDSVDSEKGSDGESSNRKLLQMDSGYASIEAPSRGPEEMRLFGSVSRGSGSSSSDGLALERRRFFTSSGHKATVCESLESSLFDEELEDEEPAGATGGTSQGSTESDSAVAWSPYGQMFTPRDTQQQQQQQQKRDHRDSSSPHPPFLQGRDYSIDEKTDALFNEFLRHDPQFDQQQESPQLRLKQHRSRVHLRKQWQRSKQYSDPGQRFASSFDRHRAPLRRGESVNYPPEGTYHSSTPLPRIVSAPDEDNTTSSSSATTSAPDTPKPDSPKQAGAAGEPPQQQEEEEEQRKVSPGSSGSSLGTAKDKEEETSSPPGSAPAGELTDGGEEIRGQAGPPMLEDQPRCTSSSSPPSEQRGMTGVYGPQTITAELADKLMVANLEERLYTSLGRTKEQGAECVVVVTHASPDHSPV